MSVIIKTIINVATDWKSVRVRWLLLRYKIAPIFSRSWLQQIIGPCALTPVPEKVWSSRRLFLGAPYDKTRSGCWALNSLYSLFIGLTTRVYSLSINVQMQNIKGWAIHLSYVDRRTDVFCLVNKWNCMRPIVARLNPVVNKALRHCYNVVSTFRKRRLIALHIFS